MEEADSPTLSNPGFVRSHERLRSREEKQEVEQPAGSTRPAGTPAVGSEQPANDSTVDSSQSTAPAQVNEPPRVNGSTSAQVNDLPSQPLNDATNQRVPGTRINKLILDGFKSFGRRTELVFLDGFNCVIGANGSGKSCAPDTQVLLSDGTVVAIGDLVESHLHDNELVEMEDGVYSINCTPLSVLTLNPETMKIETQPIAAFVRRQGDPVLYRITTESGKSVVTTSCHPVMTFQDSQVKSEKVGNLSVGQIIAAPRVLPVKGEQRNLPEAEEISSRCANDAEIRIPAQTSAAFGRWLGLLIGDGYIHPGRVEFVNADKILIEDFMALSASLFNLPKPYARREGAALRLVYHTRKLPAFLRALFNAPRGAPITTEYKDIPALVMATDEHTIAALLSALLDTDGYVSSTVPQMEYVSANKELASHVQLLLLRFGILARNRTVWKRAINSSQQPTPYYSLSAYGKENLAKLASLPLAHHKKRQRLYHWATREVNTNPNTDLLPQSANESVARATELLRIPVKPLAKRYPKLRAYIDNRCCPSRDGMLEILKLSQHHRQAMADALRGLKPDQAVIMQALGQTNTSMRSASMTAGLTQTVVGMWQQREARQSNLQKVHEVLRHDLSQRLVLAEEQLIVLTALAESDITWERISSIEQVPGTAFVYDLCIFGNHNFVANNLFVHNSNIMDAMCFVLGKTSSKSMRAEKSANLIYNGGKTKQPAKQAEVSIVFDNSEKTFPTDEQEVKLTRIVRHDGQSVYKINGKPRTRQEMLDLLSLSKIDPDGYNIILQGDITRFIEMSPVELRQIVEEIAGISIYDDKKNQALNELAKVEEKLSQADIVLREREKQMKELKKDRDQAMKYKGLNDQIRQNKATFLKKQIDEKDEERGKLDASMSKLKAKIEEISKRIAQHRQGINEKREQIKTIAEEIQTKGKAEEISLQKEVEALRVSLATTQTKLSGNAEEMSKLDQRLQQAGKSVEETESRLSQLRQQQEGLNKEKQKAKEQLEQLEQSISAFKKKHNIDADTAKLEEDIAAADRDAETLSQQIQQLRQQQQEIVREKDKVEYSLQIIDQNIAKAEQVKAEHAAEVKQLKNMQEQFKNVAKELSGLLNEDSAAAALVGQLREQLLKATEQKARLEIKQARIDEATQGNIAVKKILENRQQLGGIHGTVADLGEVQSKYSIALEIAAAQRIQSIVVEDDKTAAKCIKYLKENRFGIASFLPLNKIRPQPTKAEVRQLAKSNGCHGFAIDLIKFDQKYKDVFSYVFGSTLIVETMDTARKLGIGNAKMVTLDGDLAEHSGAMIGGYRPKRQGSFREEAVGNQLSQTDERIAALQEKADAEERRRRELGERIEKLRIFKANLDGDMIKLSKTLKLETGDLDADKSYKDGLKSKAAGLDKTLAEVSGNIEAENTKLAAFKTAKQELRAKLSEQRNPKLQAELRAYDEKKNELNTALLRMDAELNAVTTQLLDQANKDRETAATGAAELEKQRKGMEEQQASLRKQINEQTKSLKSKETAQLAFESKFKQLFAQNQKHSDWITAAERKIFESEDESRKQELELNTLSIEHTRVTTELNALQTDFAQYDGVELLMNKAAEQLQKEIADFEKMRETIGAVNLRSLEIYDAAETEFKSLVEKKQVLSKEKEDVVSMMNEIEGKKTELFLSTLTEVTKNFKRIFVQLTKHGDVELELENKEKPFDAGLDIKVRVSGTKYLDLRGLSGGEKTLSALALIFAVQECEPASFYVLDEVDAALDKHNSEKLADLLNHYSKKAQYVVISHNDAVITESQTLYGVSMNEHGVSQVVSLKV
ncbi:chromosome segregation protein SMC [Candidatus Woesearchaeota archaeon]|nr:chromosome segregation protein SMC [Candidatus Woesearchaeota archaeon]